MKPAHAVLAWLACFALLVLIHAPFLSLPYWWDEVGQFVPQSLDIAEAGAWIPRSASPNVHPPGVPAYIAAVWRVTGVSIPAARTAMLALGALLLTATLALARQLGVGGGWRAVALLAAVPVVYMQSMMVELDLPAAAWMTAALALFLGGRYGWSALACAALVATKETGVVAPLLFALLLARQRHWRPAAYFAAALLPLAAWLVVLLHATGNLFGDASFARYNLLFPLHPVRLAVAVLRRGYALLVAHCLWIGSLAILFALVRTSLFRTPAWRIAAGLAAGYAALVTVAGGAGLERYLLPVFPVLVVAMVHALEPWRSWGLSVWAFAALLGGSAACLWINPPYPFPLENNLAMTDMVSLQQQAAGFLDQAAPGRCVATTWPFSDALRRPEYGYARAPHRIVRMEDTSAPSLARPEVAQCGLVAVYTPMWNPPLSLMNIPVVRVIFHRFYGYVEPLSPGRIAAELGMLQVARWQQRGLWIEILERPGSEKRATR